MKKRIWKQIGKTGIIAATTATLLAGCIVPAIADVFQGETEPVINQEGTWTDQESGLAELDIQIRGLNRWREQQRILERAAENEDPVLESDEEVTEEAPEEELPEEKAGTEEEYELADAGEREDALWEDGIAEDITGEENTEEEAEVPEENSDTEKMEENIQKNTDLWEETEKTEEDGKNETEKKMDMNSESEETPEGGENYISEEETDRNYEYDDLQEKSAETWQNETQIKTMESGTEMEDKYEYVEELASGKTVQQENEEPEETGTGTQERTASGVEDVENKVVLMIYISEYFLPEVKKLPENISTQQLSVQNQKGEKTEITKLICELDDARLDQENIELKIPLVLRREYENPAVTSSYPLVQDQPLEKDNSGAGTSLFVEENGTYTILAEGISPSLERNAAEADMSLSVTAETREMKAGKTIRYRIDLANTGKLDLSEIRLTSSFSCPKISQYWEKADGLTPGEKDAELDGLKAGESRSLYVLAPLQNEQEKDLEHQVEARAQVKDRPDEIIQRSGSTVSPLEALKADFSVKKTADRETAAPGETVTYQICIINTGEKTLHSIVGTERFQAEGIEAQFLEQDGVILNSSRTKAMIEKLAPGDAISLQAAVKIPEKTTDPKLFNQVTVTSRETGEKVTEASAWVLIESRETAAVVSGPAVVETEEQEPLYVQEEMAREASTHPETGDETEADLFVLLMITVAVAVLGCFWLRKKYQEIYGGN